jgi:hypothetical protein
LGIILDHRVYGALKEFLGVTPDDPAREKAAHADQARKAMDLIVKEVRGLKGNVHARLPPVEHIDDLGKA